MLGDGINDTTALAGDTVMSAFIYITFTVTMNLFLAASVGMAMGAAGSAMAVKAAQVVLMSNNLTKIASTIRMGQLTRALIFENVIFSIAVKIVAIVLAMTGYMELWHAILIDIGTLIIVIVNGSRPLASKVSNLN